MEYLIKGQKLVKNNGTSEFSTKRLIKKYVKLFRSLNFLNRTLNVVVSVSESCPPYVLPNTGEGHDSKNFLVSCPPHVLLNTGGGHDTKNFLLSCPPHVLCNTGGGHDSKIFSLPSGWPGTGKYIGGTSIQASNKIDNNVPYMQ